MISILIVEDTPEKIGALETILLAIPPLSRDNITVSSDLIGAKRVLLEKQFDLMILDLSLPLRFGDLPNDDAGVAFLEDLAADPFVIPPFHIVGLTGHLDLVTKHNHFFINNLWYLIHYDPQYNQWEE